MINDYDDGMSLGGWVFTIIVCSLFVVVFLIANPFAALSENKGELVITETQHVFNGSLGMVTNTHSWFGLGGVDSTTLSFQNGSDIAKFTFNQDLPVQLGLNYTVTYKIKTNIYYNSTLSSDSNWLFGAKNSTIITPLSVILS
jgi:hypothetical protein